MPELVLLQFDKREFNDIHRRAGKGDQDALKALGDMWVEYEVVEIACFLCDAAVERPIYTMVLPEKRTRAKVVAAPLCTKCRALPQQLHDPPPPKWSTLSYGLAKEDHNAEEEL